MTSTTINPRVEILFFNGCPNAEAARDLVERVARELEIEPEIQVVEVPDTDAAERTRFLGSPSIRVNGVDVEPGAEERTNYVLCCRVYRTADGVFGHPHETWLREALAR